MKVTVTGRHMEITGVLKDYALQKTGHLTHYFDNLQRAEVLFEPGKNGGFGAEVIVHAPKGSVLVVHAQDRTATAAFDTAVGKMERQLGRLKDRLGRKGKGARTDKRMEAGVKSSEGGDVADEMT